MNHPQTPAPVGTAHQDEEGRTGLSADALKRAFLDNLFCVQGKFPALATRTDYHLALAHAVRDRLLQRWISTAAAYTKQGARTIGYLSAEFLMGPHLGNNLINLGIRGAAEQALAELGLDLDSLLAAEVEPGLGNGGLGRLAACYIDSMATLGLPALGYGIRYEHGIFQQEIADGWQVEKTDRWLRYHNPWELMRPEWTVEVRLGGRTERYADATGRERVRWVADRTVNGIPYDTPILGFNTATANTLRLWRAEAPEAFDLDSFNRGDYFGAVNRKTVLENITKILYPNDETLQGKQLRLEQQYFFVSASLQDMLRIMRTQRLPLASFHEKFAIQLNDTHPAVAVAELMRLLVDEQQLEWEDAWAITTRTFGYTNHTLLPEALERWPLPLFRAVLPRHLEIIFEINARFLDEVRARFPGDDGLLARLSLIDEHGERYVRMAHLACVGSHTINGVAELHSVLLQRDVLKDFHALWPQKFTNVTNGVTPRRFLALSNPRLAGLIDEAIGPGWLTDLTQLKRLEPLADDPAFRARWRDIKRENKRVLAARVQRSTGVTLDPDSLFDVQVKRIHEYKRQHLAVLQVIDLYRRLREDPSLVIAPRTFLFGGKAAPGYWAAKLIIKLINAVAEVVNADPAVRGLIKVVFLPNFNVSAGHDVYPAAEVSEQISTAGKEASGTGNMKFMMNGALTVGTLDGANIEIREAAGPENFFLFGMTVEEVEALRAAGYRPQDWVARNARLRAVLELIGSGHFSRGDTQMFRSLLDGLTYHDPYMLFADFDSYLACHAEVDAAYRDPERWARMSILNTARSGGFSSDRSIDEYAKRIWNVRPVAVKLLTREDVRGSVLQ
ncbi:MAG: glycogen/starch/alpha-glucan phosphorylase [Piscinibacter sp.]|uniref:glycogen/starch/alpha-glucan phosphorylase n=1 Tax=Piscinibacter sp. TaxID=1903157 RepID=UPI00258AC4DF|nr:glycogen/starch/alpha-glucan phosphorylase [Piscinibacter sp.]MCW5666594.1 glycogen/starch/alpha-glucan phosphorylase [Piscinibacter sp.]